MSSRSSSVRELGNILVLRAGFPILKPNRISPSIESNGPVATAILAGTGENEAQKCRKASKSCLSFTRGFGVFLGLRGGFGGSFGRLEGLRAVFFLVVRFLVAIQPHPKNQNFFWSNPSEPKIKDTGNAETCQ